MAGQSRWSRRQIVCRFLTAGVGVMLAACAPAPEARTPTAVLSSPTPAVKAPVPAAPAPAGKAPVTVTFWAHNHVPRVNLDKRLFEEWKKQAPEITIDYVVVPQEYEVKLTTAMAAGEGPVLYNLTTSYNYTFMHKGFASPVDYGPWGLPNQAAFEKLYVPGTLEGFKYQAKLYGVPSEVSNYALFLNQALFQEVGLDPAKDRPRTWEEMPEVAGKLTRREGEKLVRRGFDFTYMTQQGRWTSPLHTFLGMAYQLGGEPFSPDMGESTIHTEPFVEALQYQHDWIYKHKLGSPALLGSNQAFAQGRTR